MRIASVRVKRQGPSLEDGTRCAAHLRRRVPPQSVLAASAARQPGGCAQTTDLVTESVADTPLAGARLEHCVTVPTCVSIGDS